MAESKIEWTDFTFNPWRGCTKVSQGCKNCYAETLSGRNPAVLGVWGPKGSRPVAAESYWKQPLKWNRDAGNEGVRRKVFCASLADVFEGRGTMPESAYSAIVTARGRLLKLIQDTPNLDWLLLTKRPELVMDLVKEVRDSLGDGREHASSWLNGHPKPNVWIGTSVEDQATADSRIPHLLKIDAKVRFLSVEPLLGPVDLGRWMPPGRVRACCSGCGTYTSDLRSLSGCAGYCQDSTGKSCNALPCPNCGRVHYWSGSHRGNGRPNEQPISWVIVGGESGPNARPMHPDWARGLRDQCQAAGVPFLFKQWGEWSPTERHNIVQDEQLGKLLPFVIASATNRKETGRKLWHAYPSERRNPPDSNYPPVFGYYEEMNRVGKHCAGRLLDGREWDEMPEVTSRG